ncbi:MULTISPECIES: entericidin A/B family lipoprotein [Thalassospira]|uniref:Entericidin, EcnA/B family n=2 Tax=Thalassospira TaxID=168934 RepID=A0A358HMG3_9PROT|nr:MULTISPECIES: entericidin A/B family lipoprotein [Thalassospira]PKR58275.1 entericidin [Thalassospira lohafexi]HBU96368.1 entericidin, EcnA/B family [Thalassospira lucentensis]HCW66461.1 entericidin, EcnA/B family [Thalassospira lucentensis]|tara:strand:- start:1136 stop:1276 length:141 start_codon:yes stop_codon:yes gene_type:complete
MSDIMKKIFAIAMISGMGLGLAACETAEGFGQDVEDAGEAIQEEAE